MRRILIEIVMHSFGYTIRGDGTVGFEYGNVISLPGQEKQCDK